MTPVGRGPRGHVELGRDPRDAERGQQRQVLVDHVHGAAGGGATGRVVASQLSSRHVRAREPDAQRRAA